MEINTNGVKLAGAAATGERTETVSCWLSLILQRCLCHHGREIGGLGLLVQSGASKGKGWRAESLVEKDDGRLHHLSIMLARQPCPG